MWSVMKTDRWRRVDRLLQDASSLPTEQREQWLRDACAGDDDLFREVTSLLAHYDHPLPFLEEPALSEDVRLSPEQLLVDVRDDPLVGQAIGRYRIDRRIAGGGMGTVYEASRHEGDFEHRIAIKVLHAWSDPGAILRRFRTERQSLARLNHPNIAHLLDAGVLAGGMPYLMMEYIDGVPIDEYCDARRLGIRERLKLFQQVCAAVHVAHQNLIVHRDLKPGNILVTADGVPKLLDFGIAKMLESPGSADQQQLPQQTIAPMLSVDYASPEQIRGDPVTTETDIYSLGVVLYELLVGERPYRATSRRYEQMLRTICEEEPRRPSTAVRAPTQAHVSEQPSDSIDMPPAARTAQQRGTTVDRLARELRGDLDTIVLMAMRKEPHRRYGSAQQFAEDIQRFLADHPVMARKDTLAYRTGKFILRNRLAVAASVIGAAGLVTATLIIAVQRDAARVAEESALVEARHARIEAGSANEVVEFLVDAFLVSGLAQSPEQRDRALDLLQRQAVRVRHQYAEQPHLRANLLDALGQVHMNLHSFDAAADLLTEALDIRIERFGEQSLEYALSMNSLGELDYRQARYESAADRFQKALQLHETLPPGVHTDVALLCNNLAVALRSLGRADEAEVLHRRALELRREAHGERSPLVAESLNNIAGIHLMRSEHEAARRLLREALDIRRDSLGRTHPLVAQTLNNLAAVHFRDRDIDGAEPLLREAIELYRSIPGPVMQEYARSLRSLAEIHRLRGEHDEARALLEESLTSLTTLHDGPHPNIAPVLMSLAEIEESQGNQAEAIQRWREAVQMYEQSLPAEHPAHVAALTGHGLALIDADRAEAALPLLERAVAIEQAARSPGDPAIARAHVHLATCLIALDRIEPAEELLRSAHEALVERQGEASDEAAVARRRLIRLLEQSGRADEAAALEQWNEN